MNGSAKRGKLLAWLLCIAMCLSFLPAAPAYAQEELPPEAAAEELLLPEEPAEEEIPAEEPAEPVEPEEPEEAAGEEPAVPAEEEPVEPSPEEPVSEPADEPAPEEEPADEPAEEEPTPEDPEGEDAEDADEDGEEAEDEDKADEIPFFTDYFLEWEPEEETLIAAELGDYDGDAFQGYVDALFDSQRPGVAARYARKDNGSKLEGMDYAVYTQLMSQIRLVAAGERASTTFVIQVADLGLAKTRWTAEDLGLETLTDENGTLSSAARAALSEACPFHFTLVVKTLLTDCPYELYWYEKTTATRYGGYQISYNSKELSITGSMTFYFPVSGEYAADSYEVDTSVGSAVQAAVANAAAIVERYAGCSDYEKLHSYKYEICRLVRYNGAAAGSSMAYGNPWQMIWVFDDDAGTNVVCEGYAKAFQYLCDLTAFSRNVVCYTVTGKMDGGTGAGGHMWNIVQMPDGANYLVDVTNCDTGTIGADDLLFLAGYTYGSVSDGYLVSCGGGNISYNYDADTRMVYSEAELALSPTNYLACLPIIDTHFPDETFRLYVQNNFDTDGDGMLSEDEMNAVTLIKVNGVSSLAGVEFFPNLQSLTSSGGTMDALDLSANHKLSYLYLNNNQISELELDANPLIQTLYLDGNPIWNLNIGALTRLKTLSAIGSRISSLDLSANSALVTLRLANDTALGEIRIPASVTVLDANAFAGCTGLSHVFFLGKAPTIKSNAFQGVTALACYRADSTGWDESVRQDYGGSLTWIPYGVASWQQTDGKWYYFDADGNMLRSQWLTLDGKTYYLSDDGSRLEKKWFEDQGKRYYLGTGGVLAVNKWLVQGDKRYYAGSDGAIVTASWISVGGKRYYADLDGALIKNQWLSLSDGWYHFDADGVLSLSCWLTDDDGQACYVDANGRKVVSAWLTVSGKRYYLDSQGHKLTGAQTIGGTLYLFAADGVLVTNGWAESGGKTYYLDASGQPLRSRWLNLDDSWYYLNSDGTRRENDWLKDGGKWYFFASDGRMVSGGWVQQGSSRYYFNAGGVMQVSNWVQDGGSWYYVQGSGAAVCNAWQQLGGKWYYFGADCRMLTGRQQLGSSLYFFSDGGAMRSSCWVQDGGDWYYLGSSGAALRSAWQKLSGKWYYFGSDCRMLTGRQVIGGKIYLFAPGGAMYASQWVKDGGSWYYVDSGGVAYTEKWLKSGSSWYYFGSDGVMLANTSRTINGKRYSFNASGVCTNP